MFEWTKASLVFWSGTVSNLLIIVLCLPLLRVAPGMSIKPMGQTCFVTLIGVNSFALGMTILKAKDCPSGSRSLRYVGIFLCLTPYPLGIALFQIFAYIQGFSFG